MGTMHDKTHSIGGAMTALVTPFRNCEVDFSAIDRLIDQQIENGTDWLVPLGTTGESPTLSGEEKDRILDRVITKVAGHCSVMAGTGSNNTADAVEGTKRAAAAGANAALVVVPYYNRPSQEGLFRHFAAVAEAVTIPIVLYNVPARTGVSLDNDTVVRLREQFANIAAIKDATGQIDLLTDLLLRCDIIVLSGDDTLTFPSIMLGAAGVVSVVSNLVPRLMKSLVDEALGGRLDSARRLHRRVFDLAMAIGRFGPNPVPIKTAMALSGWIAEEFRLPLCPIDAAARKHMEDVLRRHEILGKTGP